MTPPDAAAYFQDVYEAFLEASRATGCIQYAYNVGGQIIQQQFAGSALIPAMSLALAHLALDKTPLPQPALTVGLWDSHSTGVPLPEIPWDAGAYGPFGEVIGYNSEFIRTIYQPGLNILHMMDMARGLAIYWTAAAENIPYWECGYPMRAFLHWWTYQRPLQLVHSGAVGLPQGGVLLAGKSGSGKSTTTLACLHSPLLLAGDDYVMVELAPTPYVHSVYSVAKLEAENTFRFPRLQAAISNPERSQTEKALIPLNMQHPEKISAGFPIRALFVPCVTGLPYTRLERTNAIKGLAALAPTTLFCLPGFRHEAFEKMSQLVAQIPVYSLELGTDLSQIPDVILDFLTR